jgi:hypothetical protein
MPRLEVWFNSMMDRVSQRFSVYMRMWSVALAFGFAFSLGLNFITPLETLANRNELYKALTGSGQQALASAQGLESTRHTLAANYDAAWRLALEDAHVALRPRQESLDTPNKVSSWINSNVPTSGQSAVREAFDRRSLTINRDFVQASINAATVVIAIADAAGFNPLTSH